MTLYDDGKVYPGSKSPYVTERVGGVGGAARQVCTRDVQGGESENGDIGDDDDDNDCGDEDVIAIFVSKMSREGSLRMEMMMMVVMTMAMMVMMMMEGDDGDVGDADD